MKLNNLKQKGNNQQQLLKFDSDFESGNLDLAAMTFADRTDEYDLIIRLDSNCTKH